MHPRRRWLPVGRRLLSCGRNPARRPFSNRDTGDRLRKAVWRDFGCGVGVYLIQGRTDRIRSDGVALLVHLVVLLYLCPESGQRRPVAQ